MCEIIKSSLALQELYQRKLEEQEKQQKVSFSIFNICPLYLFFSIKQPPGLGPVCTDEAT